MKAYLVKRTDEVGWDEYNGAVVVAESPEKAIEMLDIKPGMWQWGSGKVEVTEIDLTKPEIILQDFNAG